MRRASALVQRYGSWSAVTKACDRDANGVYVLTRNPDGTPIRKGSAVAPPVLQPVVEQPVIKSVVNPPELIRKTPKPELAHKKAQPFKPK